MRAKLQVESVENNAVIMNVIKENNENQAKTNQKQFFSDAPSGRLHFHMNNQEVAKNIKVGDRFYADFTKAPSAEEENKASQQSAQNKQAPGSSTTEQDKGKV